MIWGFGIFLFLFVWSLFYRFWHVREDVRLKKCDEDQVNMGNSLNGCGSHVYGSFSTKHPDPDARVCYIFLCLWFIPLMPIGCVLASKAGTSSSFLGTDTKYNVYGNLRMRFLEVISCYMLVWAACAIGFAFAIW